MKVAIREPDFTCQSCGMSIAAEEHFGTNSDLSRNNDYCCFCFRNGAFTEDLTMEEAIAANLSDFMESQKAAGRLYSKNEAVLKMRINFPAYKRWRSHSHTHLSYFEAINRVIEYINGHLNETINLQDIANVAHISGYHFHRIFTAVLGEKPGEYILRLRMERALFLLQTSQQPITEIAERVGYQTSNAFSKAFGKYYGMAPGTARTFPSELSVPLDAPVENLLLNPVLKNVNDIKALCLSVDKPFDDPQAFLTAWQKLIRYGAVNNIRGQQTMYFRYSEDISTITQPDKCRIYVCVSNAVNMKASGRFSVKTIKGGLYAIFTHKGPHKQLDAVYCNIYRYWLPNSNYELRDIPFFERYLNSPDTTPPDELLTEIYIPVSLIT